MRVRSSFYGRSCSHQAPQTIQEVCTAVAPLVGTLAAASAFDKAVSSALTVTVDGSIAGSYSRAGKAGERTADPLTLPKPAESQESAPSTDDRDADGNWTVHLTSKGVIISFLQCYTSASPHDVARARVLPD